MQTYGLLDSAFGLLVAYCGSGVTLLMFDRQALQASIKSVMLSQSKSAARSLDVAKRGTCQQASSYSDVQESRR